MLIDELKGIGHFTVWFLVGFVLSLLVKISSKQQRVKLSPLALYSPFIPFALGCIAIIPYLLFVLSIVSHETALSGIFNLFLLYGVLSQIEIGQFVWQLRD